MNFEWERWLGVGEGCGKSGKWCRMAGFGGEWLRQEVWMVSELWW